MEIIEISLICLLTIRWNIWYTYGIWYVETVKEQAEGSEARYYHEDVMI